MAYTDYTALLPKLVRETGDKLLTADFERAIASAVLQYSTDKPRTLVANFTWEETGYFADTVPAGFTTDSALLQAEYPLGNVPPTLVGMSPFVTSGPLGLVCETTLPAGAVVRITFTAAHALVGGGTPQDTIPLRHRDAVAHYAAHLLCRELATLYAGERESSIGADGSSTDSRARNYAARSKDYRASYYAGLEMADPMQVASGSGGAGASVGAGASTVVSWGSRPRPSWTTNDNNGRGV